MKGVEGRRPTPPAGEDFVVSRGVRYYMKQGGVGGNTSETMILVSVGSEFPAGVAVERRVRDTAMAEKAIDKYGRLPSIATGLHEEAAADLMARASQILQDTSGNLVRLCLDTPGKQRSKQYYLQAIGDFFKHCQQPQGSTMISVHLHVIMVALFYNAYSYITQNQECSCTQDIHVAVPVVVVLACVLIHITAILPS